MAQNPLGTLSPEEAIEQQRISRQQQMANLLMQQGMQAPQGQMISGRYVPPSIFQNLAGLANVYVGRKLGEEAEQKQLDLAKKLREGEQKTVEEYFKALQGSPAEYGPDIATETGETVKGSMVKPATGPNYQQALQIATNPYAPSWLKQQATDRLKPQKLTEGEVLTAINPLTGQQEIIAQGGPKTRAPVSVGNYLIDPQTGKVIFQAPEKPQAGQVVETANGPMLVNTRTGEASPIMAGGQALPAKLTSEQQKDIVSINQQRATVQGALKDVEQHKDAFSFGRGLAQAVPYGESIAGRFETPEQTQTRAYVFNNVSAVIKERAGTAQSAQELQRINSFMPAVTDNADQMIQKLKGFDKYLDDLEKGTRQPTSKPSTPSTPAQPQVFSSQADVQKAIAEKKLQKGDRVTVNGVTGTIQ